jgi:hypothetical protein
VNESTARNYLNLYIFIAKKFIRFNGNSGDTGLLVFMSSRVRRFDAVIPALNSVVFICVYLMRSKGILSWRWDLIFMENLYLPALENNG